MPLIPCHVRIRDDVKVRDHSGSSRAEIDNEPDWEMPSSHDHRVGYRNILGRAPGITQGGDEVVEDPREVREAWEKLHHVEEKAERGELVSFREVMKNQKDFHLRHPENRAIGWRYVLEFSEDWIKNGQEWPANVRKREAEQKKQEKEQNKKEEEDWGEECQDGKTKKERGENEQQSTGGKDGDAQTTPNQESQDSENKSESDGNGVDKLEDKYTAQEISFLRSLEHDKEYIASLQNNDGKGRSPQTHNRTLISIDEADQFTPDNWIPRSPELIRLTGKHPLNAEPPLSRLYEAGLITPNEFHYVRSHGPVPRLLWEFHKIEIEGGEVELSMDDLKNQFDPINIPVLMACDNSRRKELNMIKRTKGFNWGPGGVGCAYWKGPLLRDVLLAAGVPERMPNQERRKYFVHFEGADNPGEGNYATSIPFEYVMDPTNDVILAYEMNDLPLPPDHGYPVRIVIPGYVGGRCVKWLQRIWTSDKENDSHYHVWDNRTVPGFITETESEFAKTMFSHPDTACYEQNLNSVIVKPAQGEKIDLRDIQEGKTYRIEGFAYNGRGDEVQRVEVSLGGTKTWLYCIRKLPDRPLRHGMKFWTWCYWHVDVELKDLLRAESITVRCFNIFKMTQPEKPYWNVLGSMNNCWYIVKPEIVEDDGTPRILFRHPTEPATGEGGWMKPSAEIQIQAAKRSAAAPQKEFTRAEIEKHNNDKDCWIVVDGKVCDATSVLPWHPGGAAAILPHAGAVHQETTDEYASIHGDNANQMLQECILGVVTEKAMNYIRQTSQKKDHPYAEKTSDQALQKHRWVPVKLVNRKKISRDTRLYTFELPDNKTTLGIGTCQHLEVGFHMKDRMLIRPYTPTRPVFPPHDGGGDGDGSNDLRDGNGTFDLTIKTYYPDGNQPGGAMSNIMDCIPIGEEIEMRGPRGEVVYNGDGNFTIYGEERTFKQVSLALGGTGITPGFSLIARAMLTESDRTEIRVVYANQTENDILLKEELDRFEKDSNGRVEIAHVLDSPREDWKGLKGLVNKDTIHEHLFAPDEDSVMLLCGPPGLIQKTVLPVVQDWGYKPGHNVFGL